MSTPLQAQAQGQAQLADVARQLAAEKRGQLDALKANRSDLERPDFLWHYLLQSFATMGRSAGRRRLIEEPANYERLTYPALLALPDAQRLTVACEVCRTAGLRMPNRKGAFITACFDRIRRLGGPEAAKAQLLALPGRDAKIQWLKQFSGIGDKYARNLMMDVYHEDFRQSVALDTRIHRISDRLGVAARSYREQEAFYLGAAAQAGLEGWEMDRLLYNFLPIVEMRL